MREEELVGELSGVEAADEGLGVERIEGCAPTVGAETDVVELEGGH